MGKKKVIEKTKEEVIKESEAVESTLTEKKSAAPKGKYENGRVYVQASYNNTVITATDEKGNVIAWMSAGSLGFSGPKKSTPFAASKVAEAVSQIASKFGIEKISIFVKGVGSGRDSAIRSLMARGLEVVSLKDVTPIPHNGCRPPKARRI